MKPQDREALIERAAAKEEAKRQAMDQAERLTLIQKAEQRAARGDVQAQCMLHLLDLKRFGYSPTRTELNILTDRPVTIQRSYETRSFHSSSAGWL